MSELELAKCCFYCENRNSHYIDHHWCKVREEQVKLFWHCEDDFRPNDEFKAGVVAIRKPSEILSDSQTKSF
jgi:hypothetical protein